MSKFRRIIAGILILILSLSMLTACNSNTNKDTENTTHSTETTIPEGEPLHPENTTFPPEVDDESQTTHEPESGDADDSHLTHEPEDVFPPEDDDTIYGTIRAHSLKGILTLSTDDKTLGGMKDVFDIANEKLTQEGRDFVVYDFKKIDDETYLIHISEDFEKSDLLSIEISEIQDYEASISVNTREGSIGVSNHFTTRHDIRIEDEYAFFKDCFTEFAYESTLSEEDNRPYSRIQIYGQLEEMGDLTIRYDGVKYIVSSNQEVHGLRVVVFNKQTGTDGKLTVCETYGREYEITISENGEITFLRTKR